MLKKTRTVGIALFLILSATLAGIVLAEILLRAVGYSYSPLRIQVQHKSDWRGFHAFEDSSFISDSYLIWQPKRGAAVFNSQGYRGKELRPEKEPGSVRIFAIGDSNTL